MNKLLILKESLLINHKAKATNFLTFKLEGDKTDLINLLRRTIFNSKKGEVSSSVCYK
jgi:hypothetical protein